MTEEEKYRRKAELLRQAIRFADDLDQIEPKNNVVDDILHAGRAKITIDTTGVFPAVLLNEEDR